jgi:hypothetical protein
MLEVRKGAKRRKAPCKGIVAMRCSRQVGRRILAEHVVTCDAIGCGYCPCGIEAKTPIADREAKLQSGEGVVETHGGGYFRVLWNVEDRERCCFDGDLELSERG